MTATETQRIADALSEMVGGDARASKESFSPQNPSYWAQQLFGGGPTSASGVEVNERTALTFTAVFASVRILAETVGMLPAKLYRRLPEGGKETVAAHPVYSLVHDQPNSEMVPMVFKETVTAHVVTWGNGYAEIERTGAGTPAALWPITPDRVRPDRTREGRLIYDVAGSGRTPNTVFEAEDILHVAGLGFDGMRGYSPIRMAMQAIGLGLAAEEFGAAFFGNGANGGGVLEHPGALGDKAYKNLKDSWQEKNAGLANSHKPIILEEGMKYNRMTVPPEEAQFLQSRRFQVEEIARIFRVPPHMLADLERATFSNIESQGLSFVQHTMLPWLVRWEQYLGMRLLTPEERKQGYFVEFLATALLRGDAAARSAYYKAMREIGVINADEIRELENLNPLPDGKGKVYLVPLNMAPAKGEGESEETPPAAKPQQDPAPAPTEDDEEPGEEPMMEAARGVYLDAARRIVRKETLAMQRAAAKGELRAKAEEFYADHPAHVIEVLKPLTDAMTTAGMKPVDLKAVASAHVVRALASVEDIAAWSQTGPAMLVNDLIGAKQ